jgi:hypothetical protein
MLAVSIIGGRHDIAESGIKHNKSNQINQIVLNIAEIQLVE